MTFSHIGWAYLYSRGEMCETAMTDPVISHSCRFSPYALIHVYTCICPCTYRICKNIHIPSIFSLCYPKSSEMTWSRAYRSHSCRSSSSGANRYLQGAFAAPRDGASVLSSSGRLRYGGISNLCVCVDHTHTHTHSVNLTSNLIELWLFSAALALFTLLTTGHNHSSSSQLLAHIYRPTREQVTGAPLPPLLKQALTPRTHSPHSISLLFGCHLP